MIVKVEYLRKHFLSVPSGQERCYSQGFQHEFPYFPAYQPTPAADSLVLTYKDCDLQCS